MSQTTPDLPDQTEHKVVVPASVPMVALLGARDEFLRVVEQSFPSTSNRKSASALSPYV